LKAPARRSTKDRLIAHTWPDTVVDEGALRVHVATLRKALGDGRAGKRYIANVPGRGYSFVAPVLRECGQPASSPPDGVAAANNLPVPLTRICRPRRDHRRSEHSFTVEAIAIAQSSAGITCTY
jgi:DNA-binding winged helix-turn-helix (wHTH) protein